MHMLITVPRDIKFTDWAFKNDLHSLLKGHNESAVVHNDVFL